MFKNYFKLALRNLKVKKVFTLLNILGLAVGIASCWIIYCFVNYQYKYESFLEEKENIYQVVSAFEGEKINDVPR